MNEIISSIIIIVLAAISITLLVMLLKAQKGAARADALEDMLEEERHKSNLLRQEMESARLKADNARTVNEVLTPLKERIDIFSRTFTDSRLKDTAARQSLNDRIDSLLRLNTTLGEEARALTEALRGQNKVQGDWGEMILQRMLEDAGLKKDINFIPQMTRDSGGSTLRNEQGDLLRPDMVVLLPDDRRIIIDSKVSLTDYLRLTEATTEEQRCAARKNHLASVKRHIDELSSKSYQKVVQKSAEFVLMFMPMEGAFIEAANADHGLWKYASDRHVVIVAPAHLSSVLHLVNQLWRQEKQNSNAAEIARQAGLLYDRFVSFIDEFQKVDKSLAMARRTFDDCARRLSHGNVSLAARAEKLRDLGAKTPRRLSERILEEIEMDDIPDTTA